MENPGGPGPIPDASALALRAWNLMGGLDWAALPVVAEILGVRDIEALVDGVTTVRDWQNNRNTSGHRDDGR